MEEDAMRVHQGSCLKTDQLPPRKVRKILDTTLEVASPCDGPV